ncbi:hypothetical protein DFJ73DRAFT_963544 [Zopfochytrium polystomum]|nr:hypothetical protein DFJ73DRAFT_963544 [Zopfochytrium polystomum]
MTKASPRDAKKGSGPAAAKEDVDPAEMDPKDRRALFHNLQAGQHAEAVAQLTRAYNLYLGEGLLGPDTAGGGGGGGADGTGDGSGGGGNGGNGGGGNDGPSVDVAATLVMRARSRIAVGDTLGALSDCRARPPRAAVRTRARRWTRWCCSTAAGEARPEMDGFHVGVVKATASILSAVQGLDVDKGRGPGGGGGGAEVRRAGAGAGKNVRAGGGKQGGKPSVARGQAGKEQAKEQQAQERNLLEELYEDKQFLEELAADERFMLAGTAYYHIGAGGSPTAGGAGQQQPHDGGGGGSSESVADFVHKGLAYLETRVEFWRKRNPCAIPASTLFTSESGGGGAAAREGQNWGAARRVKRGVVKRKSEVVAAR